MHSKRKTISLTALCVVLLWPCLSSTAQQPTPSGSSAQPGPNGFLYTPGQNVNGMHVYLWAGLKSHGEGQHDYPQWLADWSKLLTAHGAVVDGALHAPSSADLEHTDV